MKRLLIAGTIILTTALLLGGIYYPDDPFMWLASTSTNFEVIRAGLIALLAVLFFADPPRAIFFRVILAACASVLVIGTLWMLSTYTMYLIDAIMFVEIAIIFGVEALESSESNAYILAMKRTNMMS